MIVIDSDNGKWENCDLEEESQIDDLLLRHPEILQETLYADYVIIPLAGRVGNQLRKIDVLCLAYGANPTLIVVEDKLAKNTQGRNYAVAQVIAYAASLAKMSEDELRAVLRQHLYQLAKDGAKKADASSEPRLSTDEIIDASVEALNAGRIHMVVCTEGRDGEHRKLRENVAYLNKLINSDEDVLRHIRVDLFLPPDAKRDDEAVQSLYIAAALEQARAREEVPGKPPEDWASIADVARTLAQNEELVAHLLRVQPGPSSMCVAESVPVSADTERERSRTTKASLGELRDRLSPALGDFCNRIDRTSGMSMRTAGKWLLVDLDFDGAIGAESSGDDEQRKPFKALSIEPGSDPGKPGRIRINGPRVMRRRDMPDVADWYVKQATEQGIVPSEDGMHPLDESKLDTVVELLCELRSRVDEALAS